MYEARMYDERAAMLLAGGSVDFVCQDHLSNVLRKHIASRCMCKKKSSCLCLKVTLICKKKPQVFSYSLS